MEDSMKELSRWRVCALAVVIVAPLATGCGKTVTEALDDTTVTTRVKTAMLNDPAVGGLRIDVDTFRSVVTLTGRVKSQAEHDQAIALARRTNGVSEVKDALQIIPDAR
jgi:osmotically-inducible protein OsmY